MEKEEKKADQAVDVTMEKLVSDTYERLLADGTIEKAVSDHFAKMIDSICSDMMGWNGVIYKAMKEKLESISSSILEAADFNEYVQKIAFVMNEVIRESSLGDYQRMSKALKAILGQPEIKAFSTVKLSDIWAGYKKYVGEESFHDYDFDDDDINRDDGNPTATIECTLSVEGNKVTLARNHDDDMIDTFSFTVNDEGEIRVALPNKYSRGEGKLGDVIDAGKFGLYLIALDNQYCKVSLDCQDSSDDIEVNIEED